MAVGLVIYSKTRAFKAKAKIRPRTDIPGSSPTDRQKAEYSATDKHFRKWKVVTLVPTENHITNPLCEQLVEEMYNVKQW